METYYGIRTGDVVLVTKEYEAVVGQTYPNGDFCGEAEFEFVKTFNVSNVKKIIKRAETPEETIARLTKEVESYKTELKLAINANYGNFVTLEQQIKNLIETRDQLLKVVVQNEKDNEEIIDELRSKVIRLENSLKYTQDDLSKTSAECDQATHEATYWKDMYERHKIT